MKVIIAGASGFLGSALVRHLESNGHDCSTLVRRAAARANEVEWHPESGVLAPAALTGFDAVICLSGAGIGDKRWTPAYKHELVSSRMDTTGLLARSIAALPEADRPRAFLSGSAMGFYGDRGDDVLTEQASGGSGFLPELCRDWEEAAAPAADAGTRLVYLRTSNVLAASGGLLKKLIPIFKAGIGGKLSTGSQYMSWMTLADHVAAVRHLLESDAVSGPVNLASPNPVTNAEFTKELASALHRPAVFPVPKFAIRVAIGELAGDALTSQRLAPEVLIRTGFPFEHPQLAAALTWALAN